MERWSEDLGEAIDRRPPLERRPLERCDEPSLLRFFESRFWRWKGRCYHCHKGDGVELGLADAPTWVGDEVDEAEAIAVTYRRVINRGYLNLATPAESLLILKPLAIPRTALDLPQVPRGIASKRIGFASNSWNT